MFVNKSGGSDFEQVCIPMLLTLLSLQALTEDDPLHIILDELGPPGKQLSYSMNNTIRLTLTNRWDHSKGKLCPFTPGPH